jgi:xanthine dehydrogenase accessory factor
MGSTKALLELEGRTFVDRVVRSLVDGGCREVVVVVADGDEALAAQAERAGARVLHNPDPGEGPITSLRLAIAELAEGADWVVYLPVDHPAVDPVTVARLIAEARSSGAALTLPVHGGKRGHPAVFHPDLFAELADPALQGGARTVVHRHLDGARLVNVDDAGVIADVDTPEDYAALAPEGQPADRAVDAERGAETLGAVESAELLLAVTEAGGAGAVATIVGGAGTPGRRLALTRRPGSTDVVRGTLGPSDLDALAVAVLEPLLLDPRGRDGLREIEGPEGGVELYVEIRRAVQELVVVGAGHIAQPMAHVGALLGYRVTVLDDRPDFATRERFPDAHRLVRADFSDPFADVAIHDRSHLLLVTRGHKFDYECLVRALRADPLPAYIGMIGSRRRVRATYVQLLDEGVGRELIDRIHAPVGLDIGAETPEEIAIAVAAELVRLHRGGSGRSLKDVERVAERFFKESPT